jgi:hypothetical protein
VFDDDQISVPAQTAARVHHPTGTRGAHVLPQSPGQKNPPARHGTRCADTVRRPKPSRRAIGGARNCSRRRGRWAWCNCNRCMMVWRTCVRCAGRRTRGRPMLGRRRLSGAQHQDLAYGDAEVRADVVPSRQITIVEIVAPGDAVEGVLGAHHVARRTGGGGIGACAQQQATQPNGANRARDARRYRCNPDSKGTKLTGPSDSRSIRVSPLV